MRIIEPCPIGDTETVAYHQRRACAPPLPRGALVRVLTGYRGSGSFAPDGSEGVYAVLSMMRTGNDYKLVRLPRTALGAPYLPDGLADTDDWDLIAHASRVEPVEWEP